MMRAKITTDLKRALGSSLCILAVSTSLHAGELTPLALSPHFNMVMQQETQANVELIYKIRAEKILEFLETQALETLPTQVRALVETSAKTHPITITLQADLPVDGLFAPRSENPSASSELNLFFRTDLLMNPDVFQLVSHEFFHAIHYLLKPNEEPWVREGLAQLFEFLVLKKFNGQNVASALLHISTPLEGAYDLNRIDPAQYGHSLLYFYYLWAKCGGDPLFWNLARGSHQEFGSNGVDSVLKRTLTPETRDQTQCTSFEQSAIHFEIARAHNKKSYRRKKPEPNPGNQEDIHFLLSTTLAKATPLKTVSKKELESLPRFTPLLLTGEAELPYEISDGTQEIQRFWLQKDYPFQVIGPNPSLSMQNLSKDTRKNWTQLLIRVKP